MAMSAVRVISLVDRDLHCDVRLLLYFLQTTCFVWHIAILDIFNQEKGWFEEFGDSKFLMPFCFVSKPA